METISLHELERKIKSPAGSFKLINALQPEQFEMMHIPRSLNFPQWDDLEQALSPDDEIVVYCTNNVCFRSRVLYDKLEAMGFRNLKRFSGGLQQWQEEGLEVMKRA